MSTTDPSMPAAARLARGASRALQVLELPLLLAVPGCMVAAALSGIDQAGLVMLLVVGLVLALFFAGYEAGKPALRQIMPTLVLASLAAAGRILFGAIPDFKPVSAIAIIAGAALGPRSGFMVGALAAFTSNFFFGQGMWTPWQMYAWGAVGYLGGVLARLRLFQKPNGGVRYALLVPFGFLSGLFYGVIINAFDVVAYVRPLTWPGALARVAMALPFDLMHGFATSVFLAALYAPWTRRIGRVVRKYGI
ncbi:DUF6580 family putative transport protein [Collinsella sp. D33t1_170424_A12]|uniref:DUF6580 family putative transport protein n=1 Tax=Collinsella sp. D33t1_170424_A12 TaxID=2787135 RepID=UPI001E323C66|nr:DUF6580 family putative transport protein [Collinsella sp. D33t1_170424_A12]